MRNPWTGLGSSAPYVMAEDKPYIEAWNKLPGVADSPFRLQLDLPPEPFVGPYDAPLVVLSANPGWAPADAETYQRLGAAERLAEIAMDGGACFRWLADDVQDSPGGRWWRRCLGGLREEGYSFDDFVAVRAGCGVPRVPLGSLVRAAGHPPVAVVRVLPCRAGDGQGRGDRADAGGT
jgi:hypothetical protein